MSLINDDSLSSKPLTFTLLVFSFPLFLWIYCITQTVLQATKKLTGGGVRRKVEKTEEKKEEGKKKDENVMMVYFDPGHYTVMENVGKFTVTVCRDGDLSHPIEVDFNTEDGTANDGSDYEGYNGTLTFHAGEAHKSVSISILFIFSFLPL